MLDSEYSTEPLQRIPRVLLQRRCIRRGFSGLGAIYGIPKSFQWFQVHQFLQERPQLINGHQKFRRFALKKLHLLVLWKNSAHVLDGIKPKNSMIKKEVANVINKPKIENPPCPFGYGSYGIDVGITEDKINILLMVQANFY